MLFQKWPFGSGFGTSTPRNEAVITEINQNCLCLGRNRQPGHHHHCHHEASTLSKRSVTFMSLSQLTDRKAESKNEVTMCKQDAPC